MKAGNKNVALTVAGLIFGIVAILHAIRIFTGFNLLIARHLVPVWVSYPSFVVFFALSVWMFVARRDGGEVKAKGKR